MKRRGGHHCRVADNTVWSHWQVASRSSDVNFTKNYTLLYLFYLLGVQKWKLWKDHERLPCSKLLGFSENRVMYERFKRQTDRQTNIELEGHSVERIYLRQMYSDGSVNKTILKPRLALASRRQYVYVVFSRRNIPRSNAARWQPRQGCKVPYSLYDVGESSPVQGSGLWSGSGSNLISSSMSRHLSTRNISSKSIHAFLSNLAQRQTDRQTSTGKNMPAVMTQSNARSLCDS